MARAIAPTERGRIYVRSRSLRQKHFLLANREESIYGYFTRPRDDGEAHCEAGRASRAKPIAKGKVWPMCAVATEVRRAGDAKVRAAMCPTHTRRGPTTSAARRARRPEHGCASRCGEGQPPPWWRCGMGRLLTVPAPARATAGRRPSPGVLAPASRRCRGMSLHRNFVVPARGAGGVGRLDGMSNLVFACRLAIAPCRLPRDPCTSARPSLGAKRGTRHDRKAPASVRGGRQTK
jgi:hypothetical protein